MYKVKVYVTLRESVLDPQGTAVRSPYTAMTITKLQMFVSENIWN